MTTKHALSLVLVLALIGAVVPTAAAAFPDIDDPYVSAAAGFLSDLGVMEGWGGMFWPDNLLRRAELATLAVRIVGREDDARAAAGTTSFVDVQPDCWAAGYLQVAGEMGLLRGWDTPEGRVFDPEGLVTLDHVLTVLIRALGRETPGMSAGWPDLYRQEAVELALVSAARAEEGDTVPGRGDMAVIIERALTRVRTADDTYLVDGLYRYGEPAAVRVTMDTDVLVANNASTVVVTATVVDGDGMRVWDYDGLLALDTEPERLVEQDEIMVPAERGRARWTLGPATATDEELEIIVSDWASKLKPGTATLKTEPPVAASVVIDADRPQISADGTSTARVTATILDQAGKPFLWSSPEVELRITGGPGLWQEGGTRIVRNAAAGRVSAVMVSKPGQPGVVDISASTPDLPTARTGVRTVSVREAASVEVSAEMEDWILTVTVGLRDALGYLVTAPSFQVGAPAGPSNLTVTYSDPDRVTGDDNDPAVTEIYVTHMGTYSFRVNYPIPIPLTVTVGGGILTPGETTVTPGGGGTPWSAVFLTPHPCPEDESVPYHLPVSDPRISTGIQLVDASGNPTAHPGYTVRWSLGAGQHGVISPQTSETDSLGRAYTTVIMAHDYTGPAYIEAEVFTPDGRFVGHARSPLHRVLATEIGSRIEDFMLYDAWGSPIVTALAGDQVRAATRVVDVHGAPVAGAYVRFSASPSDATDRESALAVTGSDGRAQAWLRAGKEGNASITATVVSAPGRPANSRTLVVTPGLAHQLGWEEDEIELEEGEVIPVKVLVLDPGGNTVFAPEGGVSVRLSSSGHTGLRFRRTPAGVDLDTITLTVPEYKSHTTFYIIGVASGDDPVVVSGDQLKPPLVPPVPLKVNVSAP